MLVLIKCLLNLLIDTHENKQINILPWLIKHNTKANTQPVQIRFVLFSLYSTYQLVFKNVLDPLVSSYGYICDRFVIFCFISMFIYLCRTFIYCLRLCIWSEKYRNLVILRLVWLIIDDNINWVNKYFPRKCCFNSLFCKLM